MAAPAALRARVPLFERLADAAPDAAQEHPPLRSHDRAGLQASVGRELLRLLNRRCAPHGDAALGVLDYGVPDWTGSHAANPDDCARIARNVQRAVQAFEPRLRQPQVAATPVAGQPLALQLRISGMLAADGARFQAGFRFCVGPMEPALLPAEEA